MRYDEYRWRDPPFGSGIIEGGCQQTFVGRLKKNRNRRSVDGVNGTMAIKCCPKNGRTANLLQWGAAA